MKKRMDVKQKNILEYSIGVLLLIPLFFFIVPFQNDYSYNLVIFPLTIYLPILIGLFLCKKYYYKKSNDYLGFMFFLTVISFICFLSLYASDVAGYGAMFIWIVCAFINKMLALKVYYNIVGKKKMIHLIIIFVMLILFLNLMGFDFG